jgi:hypothetical protein
MTQPLTRQPDDPSAGTRTVSPADYAAHMRTRTIIHNLQWIRATTSGLTPVDRAILAEAASRLNSIDRDNVLFAVMGSGLTIFALWLVGVL